MTKTKAPAIKKPKECFFCVHSISVIDYKDASILRRFLSSYSKILPRRRTGTCAKHQRKLALSIKRSRLMALLPYTNR